MKWWNRIVEHFRKGYEEEDLELEWDGASMEDWDWDSLLKDRNLMKMNDAYQREKYVRSCLEQMRDASAELDRLSVEYNMVTAYLKDTEEIEALPSGEQEYIQETVRKLLLYEGERKEYKAKKDRLSEAQFRHMETYEEVMPKPLEDMKEAERYRELIRQDMGRLDGERHAYQYRKGELQNDIANVKGMVLICVVAVMVCLFMLLILQFGFKMDTQWGYLLTIGFGAVAVTALYLKYLDFTSELKRTEKGINKIILLKNTVNIRYVNNTNLLDYLYMKYKVGSAKELTKIWEKYQQEKEERVKERENKEELEHYQRELLRVLRRYQLQDPDIWLHQTEALLDKREMVEIRHSLIERRQKLRLQMDYNKRLAGEGQSGIRNLIEGYPKYKKDIMDMVSRFENTT